MSSAHPTQAAGGEEREHVVGHVELQEARQLEAGQDGEGGVGQVQLLQLLHHRIQSGRRQDLGQEKSSCSSGEMFGYGRGYGDNL